MFSVFCSQVQAEVLLGPANIEALVNEVSGVAIAYRCSCGDWGVWRPGTGARFAGGRPLAVGARSESAVRPAVGEAKSEHHACAGRTSPASGRRRRTLPGYGLSHHCGEVELLVALQQRNVMLPRQHRTSSGRPRNVTTPLTM